MFSSHSNQAVLIEQPEPVSNPTIVATPKASFADRWIKPSIGGYIVTTGLNMAMPHFFGQTIGRIPVVGEWTTNAMKTVFQNMPSPLLDMLMTAGSLANFKNVKSFFVQEDATAISTAAKIANIVIFWGSAALVGYTTRVAFTAAGHIPEEGLMLPLSALLDPVTASFFPPEILPNLYFWNQHIAALNIAAQTIVTPIVENGIKTIADKTAKHVVPYIRQRFFAPANNAVADADTSHDNQASYSAMVAHNG